MPHLITFTVQVDAADEYGIDIIRNDAELHVRDLLPNQLARLFNALYVGFDLTVKIGEPSCICSVPDFWGIQGDITTYRCMRCGRKGPPDKRTTVKLISPCIDRTAVTAADIRAMEATYKDYIAYLNRQIVLMPGERIPGYEEWKRKKEKNNATENSTTTTTDTASRNESAGGDNTTD